MIKTKKVVNIEQLTLNNNKRA